MIMTTIHDWQGPVFPVRLGEDLMVADRDITVVHEDELEYGSLQVRITDEGVITDLVDSDGEVIATGGGTWDEIAMRLADRVVKP